MPAKASDKKRGKKMECIARISSAFKALSNETRLAVFENIRLCQRQAILNKDKRPSVCNVASNFDISLSTISHHMKELRNAGLIRCERRGQTIF